MATKITPRLIELTYEAVLKSFWRRKALQKFLLASHVAEKFVGSWAAEESKRDLLDRMFLRLQASDRGKAVIFQIARNISEKTTFPDLQNWEDSDRKIQEAHKSVQELKRYLKVQDETVKAEYERQEAQERAHADRQKIQKTLTDRAKLQQRIDEMHAKVGTQEGGYEFEHWFYEMLDYCEVSSRRPYKTDGRQIDGSLTHEGTTYLIELKFTKAQSDATDIDSLKAKVNKMADNTMGIMVSISGYSSVAIADASGSKTTLLLMDASHLYLFLSGGMSFAEIISRVRRHASQTGQAYLSVMQFHG